MNVALTERRTEEISYNGTSISLLLDMGVGIGGDKWPAADLFCKLIASDSWKQTFSKLFSGKRCIELGSGTGIVGILVDKLYNPSEVVITDLEDHMSHIKHNTSLNSCKTVSLVTYDWMEPLDIGSFDVILVFECVYREELYLPLIESLKSLSHPGTVIMLGLTRLFAKPLFFKLLRSNGFYYSMVPQQALPSDYSSESSGSDVGLFMCTLDAT
mmetsp:Transcript_1939/g.3081  ORF Transcript_1939/g.3081 Transcript_1939/m.3081 type:complete len:214 (+) Transcript_1939:71-712(+)